MANDKNNQNSKKWARWVKGILAIVPEELRPPLLPMALVTVVLVALLVYGPSNTPGMALLVFALTILFVVGFLLFVVSWVRVRLTPARPPSVALPQESTDFWDNKAGPYGWLHRGNRSDPCFVPGLAIVFVHGILSGARMWGRNDFAAKLFERAGMDADALAFSYRAGIFQATSNRTASVDLLRAIEFHFRAGYFEAALQGNEQGGYDFLLFICHSNGGIVFKRLITNASERDIRNRSLAVFNIAVPHGGATFTMSALLLLHCLVNLLILPALWLFRLFSFFWRPLLGVGFNAICLELCRGNRRLRELEADYQSLSQRDRPFPVSHDWAADEDLAVGHSVVPDGGGKVQAGQTYREVAVRKQVLLRGGHILALLSQHELVENIGSKLERLRENLLDHLAAKGTIIITEMVDRQLNIRKLIGDKTPSPDGQQANVGAYIESTWSEKQTACRIVVTGPAGVGKSRLLAHVAKNAAGKFLKKRINLLEARPARSPLPINIQLERVSLSNSFQVDTPSVPPLPRLLATVVGGFAAYVEAVAGVPAPAFRKWLLERLGCERTLLIIDGIDDFLNKYPEMRWEDFSNAIDFLSTTTLGERPRVIILGARHGLEGLRDLTQAGWQRCEVRPMTDLQVMQLFPDAEHVLKEIRREFDGEDQETALELLRTPLVAFAIGGSIKDLISLNSQDRRLTLATVLEFALSCILRQRRIPLTSSLNSNRPDEAVPIRVSLDALMLLGRIYYWSRQRLFTLRELQDEAGKLATLWKVPLASGDGRAADLYASFNLITSDTGLSAMLSTVFQSMGSGRWGIAHDYWQAVLVARYIARCAESDLIDEFGSIVFLPGIVRMAADLLETPVARGNMIRAALTKSVSRNNILYIGNIHSLYSWNPRITFDGDSYQALRDCVADRALDCFARCFILAGLYRLDISQARPSLGASPGTRLLDLLTTCVSTDADNGGQAVLSNLAWCFLKDFGALPPEARWHKPEREHATCFHSVLNIPDEVANRTFQIGFGQLVKLVLPDYMGRRIMTVFYLYALTLLFTHNKWIPETRDLLKEVFSPASEYEKKYASENSVPSCLQGPSIPELYQLWQHCRDLYRHSQ